MTRLARLVALTLLISVGPWPALAQEGLARRVSLDLKAMAPAEAFKVLGDAVGMPVTVDPAVTVPVDILVRNVTARTALTTICDSIGCRWAVATGTIIVKPADGVAVEVREGGRSVSVSGRTRVGKEEAVLKSLQQIGEALSRKLPADMKFENAPLAEVGERLGAALGLTLTITSEKQDVLTLTADLGGHTLQTGLRLLSEQVGFDQALRIVGRAPADGEGGPAIAIKFGGKPPVRKK
jgi:type II secretory pathway component GspD/PulD (secretin)